MILVSAGHYPSRQGASFNQFYEYPQATIWAAMILEELKSQDVECRYVPTGKLAEKILFINEQHATLAIDIHFNADIGRRGKGCETLHYPDSKNGIEAAGLIQSKMSDVMGNDRGIKAGYYRMDKTNGVDYFLAKTNCTALIIEPEFIHNRDDIIDKRKSCCEAIAKGIIDYVG